MFVTSGAYTDFMGRYAPKGGIIPAQVKGIQSNPFTADLKTLVTGLSSTSAGAYVMNDRYGSDVDLIGQRALKIADLVTKGSTNSDTVEYVTVTTKTNNAATVAEATTSAAGAISGATPGPYVVATPSGTKPESALALAVVSTTVKTIAHWIPITKRAASDAAQVRTLIDNFLRYGLDEELEDQIQLWGLKVVVSEAMTENTALVGDFRQAVLWNREGASILVSDQHSDFFTRNLLAILAERRDAFGVLDPQGFCTVTSV